MKTPLQFTFILLTTKLLYRQNHGHLLEINKHVEIHISTLSSVPFSALCISLDTLHAGSHVLLTITKAFAVFLDPPLPFLCHNPLIPQQNLFILLPKYIRNKTVPYHLHCYDLGSSHHSLTPGISQQLSKVSLLLFPPPQTLLNTAARVILPKHRSGYITHLLFPPLAVHSTWSRNLGRSYIIIHSVGLLHYTRLSLCLRSSLFYTSFLGCLLIIDAETGLLT